MTIILKIIKQDEQRQWLNLTAWNDETKWWKFIHNDYFQEQFLSINSVACHYGSPES